jgi:hypothetical protein
MRKLKMFVFLLHQGFVTSRRDKEMLRKQQQKTRRQKNKQ